MKISEEVLKEKDYCISLRRHFHKYPELSLQEYKTAKKIEEELDKLSIKHERVGETGVVGYLYGKKKGKTIGIRADMDALAIEEKTNKEYASLHQGVMHACGHDSHTAALLLVGKLLKDYDFDGEIRLFFQQSEENGQGARQFVQKGLCKDLDRVVAYHAVSDLPIGTVSITPGPQMASCDYFKIEVKGKAAHVSTPHLGIDALSIACQIVTALKGIVSTTINPLDTVIIGVGKMESGTAYNIVADSAIIEGTTRTFSNKTRLQVNGLIKSIANNIASSYGANCHTTIINYANPLINDEDVCRELLLASSKYATRTITDYQRKLGADDFADFLEACKGCYIQVGSSNDIDQQTSSAHHNELFDIDERSMLLAASIIIDYVKDYLKN